MALEWGSLLLNVDNPKEGKQCVVHVVSNLYIRGTYTGWHNMYHHIDHIQCYFHTNEKLTPYTGIYLVNEGNIQGLWENIWVLTPTQKNLYTKRRYFQIILRKLIPGIYLEDYI
jgi:hypothetical protein